MKKNYKELNNLLLDFIPERFTITWLQPDFNSKGVTDFRFRIALNDFAFDISCSISEIMLFLGTLPEIRILSKDYNKIKKVYDKMKIDYERSSFNDERN
jgi:hypothetical protein